MFITLEGLDGSGKSTICSMLYDYLKEHNIPCVQTSEPGGTVISDKCKDILFHSTSLNDRAEVMLFLASRAQHVEEFIKPNLEKGNWIICDRYIDSFLAYQSFGRGFDFAKLLEMNDFACYNLYPDITFYLETDLDEALGRETEKNRISASSREFYERIEEGFDLLVEQFPERFIKIDAKKSLNEVFNDILSYLNTVVNI